MTKRDASDAIWKRAEIESPCVKLCVIHPETRLVHGLFSQHRRDRWLVFDDPRSPRKGYGRSETSWQRA